uniref:Brain specific homeobox n=1 Tax=Falco tinnunculus TaxID=100819 RepID=A0A8C4UC25_FALTI
MNLNFTSAVPPGSAPRPTSFFIEDILLHKPKPLREVPPEHFPGSLASRVPFLDYGYPLMPTPTLLAPHPHPALHKPEHHHHHPYFLTASGVPVPALFPAAAHAELPGKHCRRRKARTVFSDSQLSGLEKRFEIQRYLSTPERVELATALSLSETQVRGGGTGTGTGTGTARGVPDGNVCSLPFRGVPLMVFTFNMIKITRRGVGNTQYPSTHPGNG